MTRFNRLAIGLATLLTGLLIAMFLLWCIDQNARLSLRMARELKLSADAYYALSLAQLDALDDRARTLRDESAATPAQFDAAVARLKRHEPLLVDAALYDELGRRLDADGSSALGQPWFVGLRRRGGDGAYLDNLRQGAGGRWLIALARPRLNAQGRFDGAVVLHLDALALSRRLARFAPGPGVGARWRHLDGTLVALVPPVPEQLGVRGARPDPLNADEAATMQVDEGSDEPWRIGPQALGDWPLFLEVAARRGAVDRLLVRQSLTVAAIGLLALAVLWGFLYALVRQHRSLLRTSRALEHSYREIHLLHEKLKERAVRDPLTGTYNRVYLDDILPKEFARASRHGEPVTIVMIDFDHFKRINDDYGHLAGDVVLRTLGRLLRRWVRAGDVVGRYGGEEFIMILPGLDPDTASSRVESWRAELAATPVAVPGLAEPLAVTASFGIAAFPLHGQAVTEVVERADAALYEAKRRGRNRVCSYGQAEGELA